jgi:hypothetical protein
MDEVDQMPQVSFVGDLGLERRHGLASSVANAAEDLTVRRSALIQIGRGEIGGVRHDIDLSFPVRTVTTGAKTLEYRSALRYRFLGEWYRIL